MEKTDLLFETHKVLLILSSFIKHNKGVETGLELKRVDELADEIRLLWKAELSATK